MINVNEAPINQFFLDPEKTKLSPVAIMFLNQIARVAQGKDWSAVKAADSVLLNGHTDAYFAAAEVYAIVTGSNVSTTSLTAVDITGLSVPLDANSSYIVEAHLLGGTTTANGVKHGMNFSAAGVTYLGGSVKYWGEGTDEWSSIFSLPVLTGVVTSIAEVVSSDFYCFISTGANPGNLTMQHLKVTSGTSYIYIGSYMKVKKKVA